MYSEAMVTNINFDNQKKLLIFFKIQVEWEALGSNISFDTGEILNFYLNSGSYIIESRIWKNMGLNMCTGSGLIFLLIQVAKIHLPL